MPAHIKPVGVLKSYVGGKTEVAVEPGRTVREALTVLGIPPEIVAMVLVNDVQQPKDYCMQDGDIVRLIMVVGGGTVINDWYEGLVASLQTREESMKVLAVRSELCNGCGECEKICATTFYKVSDRARSSIRVAEVSGGKYKVEFCDQCGECIAVCPPEALYRAKNGIVRLRDKDCVGCLACVGFCPTLVMYTVLDDTVPFKCIACGKCVDVCPTKALYMVEADVPLPVTELTRSVRLTTGEGSHGH